MAEEYGLSVEYKEEFHQVFEEHREHSEFGPLMVRMKVVDSEGESAMDEDQWEAASANILAIVRFVVMLTHFSDLYIAFAFRKR